MQVFRFTPLYPTCELMHRWLMLVLKHAWQLGLVNAYVYRQTSHLLSAAAILTSCFTQSFTDHTSYVAQFTLSLPHCFQPHLTIPLLHLGIYHNSPSCISLHGYTSLLTFSPHSTLFTPHLHLHPINVFPFTLFMCHPLPACTHSALSSRHPPHMTLVLPSSPHPLYITLVSPSSRLLPHIALVLPSSHHSCVTLLTHHSYVAILTSSSSHHSGVGTGRLGRLWAPHFLKKVLNCFKSIPCYNQLY